MKTKPKEPSSNHTSSNNSNQNVPSLSLSRSSSQPPSIAPSFSVPAPPPALSVDEFDPFFEEPEEVSQSVSPSTSRSGITPRGRGAGNFWGSDSVEDLELLKRLQLLEDVESTDEDPDTFKRRKVQEEIVVTEKTYCERLLEMINMLKSPMQNNAVKLGISQDQVSSIFGIINSLNDFHLLFLRELEDKKTALPQVFMKYADFFKMYTQYMNGYESSLNILNSLQKNKKFSDFLELKRAEMKNMGIAAYLILPVQRIPRYVLLLKELLKYTPETHPEHEPLVKALKRMSEVASFVNQRKREYENISKLYEVQNRVFGCDFPFMIPTRRLLKEGQLKSKSNKDLTVYLFNDYLVWANAKGKFKGKMPLGDIVTIPSEQQLALDLHYQGLPQKNVNQQVMFKCKDDPEFRNWFTAIVEADKMHQELLEKTKQFNDLRKRAATVA